MRWKWDEAKNRANGRKHKINFADAVQVFDAGHCRTTEDPYPHEARLRTFGIVNDQLLLVVYTEPVEDPRTGELSGRIISARRATSHERREYEEGTL